MFLCTHLPILVPVKRTFILIISQPCVPTINTSTTQYLVYIAYVVCGFALYQNVLVVYIYIKGPAHYGQMATCMQRIVYLYIHAYVSRSQSLFTIVIVQSRALHITRYMSTCTMEGLCFMLNCYQINCHATKVV